MNPLFRNLRHCLRMSGLLFALTCLAAGSAIADRVTRGPYLQMGNAHEVTVHWRTDVSSVSRVLYGTSPDQLDQTAEVEGTGTEHIVRLEGLSPATEYFYKVQAGASQVGDSSNHFYTAPEAGSEGHVRVWAIGDSGSANSNARAVRDAYRNLDGSGRTDVWLMLGDNAYDNGTDSQYQRAVFDMYPEFLKSTVLWSTLGNHDGHTADSATQSGPYYDIFDLPTEGEAGGVPSGTEAYYSFDYANIHFICLESYETDRSTSGAMYRWLESDLAANTQPWTIAFWHHPPYSKGSHDSDTDSRETDMRRNFNPLLEQYGVDLVLSGHSHSYERSYLIDGHYGQSSGFTQSNLLDGGDGSPDGDGAYEKGSGGHEGAVYIVAGSSAKTSSMHGHHPVMIRSSATLGSVVLDIEGSRLDARFLTNTGDILDRFTILKGETSSPSRDSTVTLDAVADVSVGDDGSRDNGQTVNADGDDQGHELRALFRWDTSSVPSGSQVLGAKLRFNVVNRSRGNYDIYLVTDAWTEANADWETAQSLGTMLGTLHPEAAGDQVMTLDDTGIEAVQSWVDGEANAGIVLVSTGTTDGVDIASRESGSAARLEIRYQQGAESVPAAPSDLGATAAGSTRIDLSWTDNADNEARFVLERSPDGTTWGTAATLDANTTTYSDTGLTPGTTYHYRVRAANDAGDSPYSNSVAVTTDAAAPTVPAAPTDLSATAQDENKIDLGWTDNADDETSFELQRRAEGGSWATIATLEANVTQYSDDGLQAGTTYEYRVRAVNGAGASAYSAVAQATTATSNQAQRTFSAVADVHVREGGTRYNENTVNADGDDRGQELRALFRWELTGLPEGSQVIVAKVRFQVDNRSRGRYDLRLATGAWTESDASWSAAGDTGTLIGSFVPSATGAQVVELDASGVAAVQEWIDGGDNWGIVLLSGGTSDGVDIASRESGTAAKLEITYTTQPSVQTPAAPSELQATAVAADRIDLGWTDNADNETGFEIQRRESGGAWSTLASPGADSVSYADTGLSSSTTYEYRVRAVGASGSSDYSAVASATTPAAGGGSEPQTLTLRDGEDGYTATQDGWISSRKKTRAFNGSTVKADGSNHSYGKMIAFLQWDLSGIPAGAVIDTAKIVLDMRNSSKGDYGLYAMTSPWSEGQGLTWEAVDGESGRGSVLVGTLSARGKGRVAIELNSEGIALIQSWVDGGSANHGFMILDQGTKDGIAFTSSNDRNVANRPALVLEYHQ